MVKRHPANQLNIKMAHAGRAFACLAHRRKGLGKNIVKCFAPRQPRFKFSGFRAQSLIGKFLKLRLKPIDLFDCRLETLDNLGVEIPDE